MIMVMGGSSDECLLVDYKDKDECVQGKCVTNNTKSHS